jgi:hypothetical protein
LRHMNVLAMELQKDNPSAVVFTWFWLEICICRQQLVSLTLFRVFDLSKKWTPQNSVKEIPHIEMEIEDLQPNTQELLTCLEKELSYTFPNLTVTN